MFRVRLDLLKLPRVRDLQKLCYCWGVTQTLLNYSLMRTLLMHLTLLLSILVHCSGKSVRHPVLLFDDPRRFGRSSDSNKPS